MLRTATIVVYLHDVIETAGIPKEDIPKLRDRVREIVAAPVQASMRAASHETHHEGPVRNNDFKRGDKIEQRTKR